METFKDPNRLLNGLKALLLLTAVGLLGGCGGSDDEDVSWQIEWNSGGSCPDPNSRGGNGLVVNDPGRGEDGASGERPFVLKEVYFGRPIFDERGAFLRLVNPASLIAVDPVTGFTLPGYPRTLFEGDDLERLTPLGLEAASGAVDVPRIVPRNAALCAVFSKAIDPSSLKLNEQFLLTKHSPVALLDSYGQPVPVKASVRGTKLCLIPAAREGRGFPPSPIPIDSDGCISLIFNASQGGEGVFLSESGEELNAREDGLGTPMRPVTFNPGNEDVDFIDYPLSFNGYLPDLEPPRIVRAVLHEGIAGPGSSTSLIVDPEADFNVSACRGHGEWAGALVVLRPGAANEERARVQYNTSTALLLEIPLSRQPLPGVDAYTLKRAEYYEPIAGLDPATAVDPVMHPRDPGDPEDLMNADLSRFIEMEMLDDSTLKVAIRFSEPMEPISAAGSNALKALCKTSSRFDPSGQAFPAEPVRILSGRGGTVFTLELPRDGSSSLPAAGEESLADRHHRAVNDRAASGLRLVIRSIPSEAVLDEFYRSLGERQAWPSAVVAHLHSTGLRGMADLAGRPLGFPRQFMDIGDPFCVVSPASPGHGPFPPAVDYAIDLSCEKVPSN